jgi:hypothetical protein
MWELLFSGENDADVLAFWVLERVTVIPNVAGFGGIDAVISSHLAVVAGKPSSAALAKDDVARNDIFSYCPGQLSQLSEHVEFEAYLRSSSLLTAFLAHLSHRSRDLETGGMRI